MTHMTILNLNKAQTMGGLYCKEKMQNEAVEDAYSCAFELVTTGVYYCNVIAYRPTIVYTVVHHLTQGMPFMCDTLGPP